MNFDPISYEINDLILICLKARCVNSDNCLFLHHVALSLSVKEQEYFDIIIDKIDITNQRSFEFLSLIWSACLSC